MSDLIGGGQGREPLDVETSGMIVSACMIVVAVLATLAVLGMLGCGVDAPRERESDRRIRQQYEGGDKSEDRLTPQQWSEFRKINTF